MAEWLISQWLASWFHNGFVYVKILLKIEKKSPEVFLKVSLNSQENIYATVFFFIKLQPETFNFIKKDTLARVLTCEF